MPLVQMQRVRSYASGSEEVIHAVNLELRDRNEYDEHLAPMERACGPHEFVRTLGSDSPLLVRIAPPEEES